MIDIVSNTELGELAARHGAHCVSIHLPTHRAAALAALAHGGQVFVVDGVDVPGGGTVAGVLRY